MNKSILLASLLAAAALVACGKKEAPAVEAAPAAAVSYTHLTLPTTSRV